MRDTVTSYASWTDDRVPDPERMSTVTIEQRTPAPPVAPTPAPVDGRPVLRRAVDETAFVLAWFPLSIAAMVLVFVLFGVGIGLAVTIVGLPVLAGAAYGARGLAMAKRSLLRSLMKQPAPTPTYYRSERGPLRRALTTLRDPQSWLDMLHAMFTLPLAVVGFVLAVVWWAGTLGGLTAFLWVWSLPRPDSVGGWAIGQEFFGITSWLVDAGVYTVIGLVFAVTLPWVVRAAAWVDAGPALLMLCGRAQLQHEIAYQVKGREAARSAEAGSLRRLERDIHDGPQQRLVRLSMDLGRAKKQLDRDPVQARETIDEAISQTRATLDELRALSRGIAPPVLSDRGLRAALEEIVARSTLPVHLTLDVPDHLPEHVETACYFVVSEALTNVAKHALASYALVDITHSRRTLRIAVTDDGVGGAQLAKGHGLVGLSDRVRGVDGILNVSSPPGGPTEIVAEIACAS